MTACCSSMSSRTFSSVYGIPVNQFLPLDNCVPKLPTPLPIPFPFAVQMCADQFGDTITVSSSWAQGLFQQAASMSSTGEVTCQLFVDVVQGAYVCARGWCGLLLLLPCTFQYFEQGTLRYCTEWACTDCAG